MMESPTDKYSHVKRCINCGFALPGNYSKYNITSLQPKCQEVLKRWTEIEDLSNYQLCIRCGIIIDEYSESNDTSIPDRTLGCQLVCVGCGMSLVNKYHMKIKDELIPIATKQWPWYNTLKIQQISCRKCIQRLQRTIGREKKIKLKNDLETTNSIMETTNSTMETTNSETETSINELGFTGNKLEMASNDSALTENNFKKTNEMFNNASRYVLVPCPKPTTSSNIQKIVKIDSNNLQAMSKKTNKSLKLDPLVPKGSILLGEIVKKNHISKFPRLDLESNHIILSDGRRTSSTNLCFISTRCGDSSHRRIPKSKRRLLATCYDLFVPANSRVCGIHISFDEYDHEKTKCHKNFSVPQFEAFVDEIKQGMAVLDFENVEAMPDHICEYWTGLKVTQFVQIYEDMNQPKLMKSALAAYFISKITGDSVQKLAKLFNIDSATLKKQLKSVETHFSKNQKVK